jgi:hypothetical protein
MSVPTRLFADWEPEPSRQVPLSPHSQGTASCWSKLRHSHDTQQLADRARSYILAMLHQDAGPRCPGK